MQPAGMGVMGAGNTGVDVDVGEGVGDDDGEPTGVADGVGVGDGELIGVADGVGVSVGVGEAGASKSMPVVVMVKLRFPSL